VNYYYDIQKRCLEDNSARLNQFGLLAIDSLGADAFERIGVSKEVLTTHGAWAVTNFNTCNPDLNVALLAIKASRPHLAYLPTFKLTQGLAQKAAGRCFVTLGTFDHVLARMSQAEIKMLVSTAIPIIRFYLSDLEPTWISEEASSDWYWWTLQVARLLPTNKTFQLLGEDSVGTVLQQWLLPSMVTAFLSPQFFDGKAKPTLVPCGSTELPFLALSREVAPKLGFIPPTGILLSTIPNTSASNRMSSKNPETALFLDENPTVLEGKLRRSTTGGRPQAEHAIRGGNYMQCAFLRIASIVDAAEDTSEMVDSCRSGMPCSQCKCKAIPRITRKMYDFDASSPKL
jgi:hypothetical protein